MPDPVARDETTPTEPSPNGTAAPPQAGNGPFVALDRQGRRFMAATQEGANAMRNEWEIVEARERGGWRLALVRLRHWWGRL